MNKKISNKQAWENFLSNKETLPDKDIDIDKKKKIMTTTFDLHGYSLDEANKKVSFLIEDSYKKGIKKISYCYRKRTTFFKMKKILTCLKI